MHCELTQTEKAEILDGANRALRSIEIENDQHRGPVVEPDQIRAKLLDLRERARSLDRLMIVGKGAMRPKYNNRQRRLSEICLAAERIAAETGSRSEDVLELFLDRMKDFVSPTI